MTTDTRQADNVRARVPSLFEIFRGKVADGCRQIAKWRKEGFLNKAGMQRRRGMRLEALEPRVLLSADLTYSGAAGTAMDAALRVADIDGAQMLQLVDNASSAVLGEALLDQDINVSIRGAELNDVLRIDFDHTILAQQVNVNFDGGDGDDKLTGPALDSTWFIDGENSGRAGSTSFTSVENLEGATDNEDTFVVEASGSLSGVADGGAGGFDSLVVNGTFDTIVFTPTGPHSGYVDRDGDVIEYAGLEPVTDGDATHVVFNGDGGGSNVDTWILEDSPTAGNLQLRSTTGQIETTEFAATAATITLNLGAGNDSVTIASPGDSGFTGSIIVNGNADDDTMIVSDYTGNVTFAGGGGNNTIAATKNQNFILTNSSLSAADGLNVGLTDVGVANLTGGGGDNTFTVSGWTGGGTLAGGAGEDIVVLAKNAANITLTNTSLSATGGPGLTLDSIGVANLTGGAGANTFTLNGWTGTAQLSGLAGDDVYAFGPGRFGTVTITGATDSGTDTLDFTALGATPDLTVTNAGASISKGTDSITQTGGNAEEIDATLDSATLQTALDDLLGFVRQMKEAQGDLQALRNQLPLLDRAQASGLADVVALTTAFEKFVGDAKTAINGKTRLSEVVGALNALTFPSPLPTPLTELKLTVATSYRGEDPDVADGLDDRLELLLDFSLHAEASKEFDIDLGEAAENIGVAIDGTVTAQGTLDADFSIGLSTGATPTAFLVPGATFVLEVAATATLLPDTPINLSFLELTGSGQLKLGGRLGLSVVDSVGLDDGRIDLTAFTPAQVLAGTPVGTLSAGAFFESTVQVKVKAGLEVDGVDLSTLGADKVSFNLSLPVGADPFGDSTTGAIQPKVSVSAVTDTDPNLDLLNFSNISPSEILGMLQQVSDFLSGISGSEFLATPIPFTELTLGDVLDFGLGFKQSIIDPLFKSGDSLKPDNNGDGAVDAKDLNFSSVQQLGERLTGISLGGGGPPSNFKLTPQYISGADVSVRGKTVSDTKVQLVTVQNADGGTFKLRLHNAVIDKTTEAIAHDASDDVVKTRLNDAFGAGTVTDVSVSTKGPHSRVYEITFATDPEVLLLEIIKNGSTPTLDSADHKELSLRLEYTPSFGFGEARVGTSLEGGSGINEKQTVTLNAVASGAGDGLDDTFQLGLRLDASSPLLFTSNIAWNATAAEVESALERLGVTLTGLSATTNTQTLTLRNTAGGDFTVSQVVGGITKTSAAIGFDVDVVGLNKALISAGIDATATADGNGFKLTPDTGAAALTLGTIRSERSGDLAPTAVDVSVTRAGKIYTVLFDQPALAGTNVPQMVSDSSELLGELSLDFGASLGDLATLTTEGGFSALASLTTGITFGLDLNPSQELAIAPVVFAPGPKVEVRTLTPGDGNVAEVQTITIRNANDGTFTLTQPAAGGKSTTDPVAVVITSDDATRATNLQDELNELDAFKDKNVSVTALTDAATGTIVYTITFDKASGNVPELQANGSFLKGAAHNGRLAGTDPATFTVEVLNKKFDLAGGGVVRNVAEQSLGSFTIIVAPDSNNNSLADLRDDVAHQINEALKAFGLGFFDTDTGTLSTGALKDGESQTATGAPLTNLHNDIEFTLQITQKVDSGSYDGSRPTDPDDTPTTLNRAGGFSNVKVGDQVWNIDDGSRTTVKAVGQTTITIGALTGGGANAWIDGDDYEIRRPTEVTGRLRAVDMLDQSTDVLVAAVGGQTGVQTVTIKNGAQGSFVLGLGSLVTRAIDVDASVDRPFAAVSGTTASQQLIIERAEDGTFDLKLGAKSAVNLAFDITETALKTKLQSLLGVSINTVTRTVSGDTVTYAIDFATDPGALLTVDGTKLRGSSIEEALAGFNVQSVSDTTPGGSADRQITIIFNSAPGELLRAGNGTLLDASGALDPTEADRTVSAADYVGPLQRAIDAALGRLNAAGENAALETAVFLDFAVSVEAVGTPGAQTLQLSVSKVPDGSKVDTNGNPLVDTTDSTLELRFRSPIQADAGGGKITLSTSPVLYSTDVVQAATRVERRVEISTEFDNAAYQQIGVLTAPTRFDGKTSDKIDLTLKATPTSGAEVTIHVVVDAGTRLSIDKLIEELQAQVDANNGAFADGDILVKRADAEKEGNRIAFVGAEGKVKTISMFVPDTAAGGGANGAITELGFKSGQGDTKRGKAAQFFVEDAVFSGSFAFIAHDVAATATFGFLGIRAEGSGTIGDASVSVSEQTPSNKQVQVVTLSGATGGTFRLSLDGDRTDGIAFNAPASAVQNALTEAGISATVTGGNGGPYTVTFATAPSELLEADNAGLEAPGDDKFLAGSIDLGLRNPEDGGSRLTPGDIVNALRDGRIFFDGGDLVAAGSKTGVLDGGIAAQLGFELGIAPDGFLSGLADDLNASLEIGVGSPNWLVARPSLSDPLGFGDAKDKNGVEVEGPIVFTGADDKFTLGENAPQNGELDTTLSFVIKRPGVATEAVGVLKKEDTQAGASASTTQQGTGGTNGTDEIQVIRVANASGGTFKITFDGETSSTALGHFATDVGMASALQEVGFATADFTVTVATEAGSGDRVFTVKFKEGLAKTNVGDLGIAEDELTRTRAELQADLQAAINGALVDLGGTALRGKITTTIDATGKIELAGESGFSIRGNTIEVDFTGPDFEGLLANFKNLSFRDIIAGLEKAVEFLQSLDGSDGNPAKVPQLNTNLPLINRSVSDLLDPAKDFLEFVDGIAANPAGSVQQLNVILADALGFAAPVASVDVTSAAAVQTVSLDNVSAGTFTLKLGNTTTDNILLVSDSNGALDTGALETSVAAKLAAITGGTVTVVVNEVPSSDVLSSNLTLTITFDSDQAPLIVDGTRLIALDILSLSLNDPANPILDIDFGFGVGVNLSRPFDLDLADAIAQLGLPDFLTNLVGVDASGTLAVEAGVDLNLAFGFDLTGDDKAMYIRTADTGITARAEAVGTGLEFGARVGPFGLFVVDGEAGVNGLIDIGLVDADADGRLVLVGISAGVTNDLGHLGDFIKTEGIDIELTGGAELPLFIGTEDNKLPLDFGTATPGTENSLIVSLDAVEIFDGAADGDNGIDITFPQVSVDFLTDLEVPSLFALLSDPAVVIDGLDRLLLTLQEALNGQIMGIELPFVGDLLADNPAANIIGDFRDDLLKPLARMIRENNLDLDGLIDLFQDTLFDVLGPTGPFASFGGLLKDSADPGTEITVDDIVVVFLDAAGNVVTPDPLFSNAQALQFDFDLGKSETFMAPEIEFDLGVPALGIEVDLQPRISIDFNLHIGFGVDEEQGFYFVTDFDRDGDEEPDDELSLDIVIDFGSTEADPASATGRLLVLALSVTDGVDTDGDGELEFSNVTLHAGVNLVDPGEDGRLTFPEMTSGSLSDIFVVGASGGAHLRLAAEVDFSSLDPSLASVLPSISTSILVDFSIEAVVGSGITVHAPEVAFIDVTLDLGSFISDFAGPVLEAVGDVLGPLEWLIGPDGFLNKRIPLLSDLLGKTVTGKDLIVLYDPKNGPKVVAFLDFVEQLYFLTELVTDAAAQAKDGSIMINFGDVVLFDDASGGLDLTEGGGIVDQLFQIGLPSVSDLRDLKNLKDTSVPSAPKMPDLPKATGSKTSEFTKGVTKPGAVNFPLLKPENVFKLLMGQTVSLVEIQLPELGFEFFYRQTIPIWGPIVGFFSGKIGGTLNLGFGYDTLGLEQFLVTDNPANLINGFFLNDLDPVTGFDRPEAELDLEIAIGAGLSLGFITAGVEGGFGANIDFNLSDLNDDGKVRFDELAGNIVANSFNPLAIFDISGKFDLFLRAFYEINLGLFSISDSYEFARITVFAFDIPFERPSILAVQNGDVLTLNVGSNSAGRLQGDIRDISERVNVETKSDGSVVVWSDQFNVNRTVAGINPFVGVKKIVADGGAGNDFIDLSGVVHGSIEVEIHGGEGNDTIIGSGRRDVLFGDGGNDRLEGRGGDDELDGGAGNDVLLGGDGADVLFGKEGDDNLNGGLGADSLDSGPGDDQLNGGGGDDFYVLKSAGSIVFIDGGGEGLDVLDFRDKSENVSFFLRGGQALAGWGARTGTFDNPLNTAGLGNWLEDYEHMVVASSLADLSAVYGGRGADTFHVYETRSDDIVTLLDGKQGSDSFIFYAEDGTPIDAFVSDNGNDWDLRNVIEVRGTDGVENITVTANDISVGLNQLIRYESPAVDENLLQIKVKSFGGDDRVNVASTSITVPVKVFAGSGDDTLTVGDGVVNNINAVSQPGVEQPFGLGPLVLIGEEGHDTVIIDDSLDSNGGDTGYLTSFMEPRLGDTEVEVGVVSGLGMTLNQLVDFEIADDEFELAGAPVDLTYTLDEAADTVFVDVLDENDVLVKTFAGPGASGLNTATFDGTNFAGAALANGAYTYKVRAFKVTPGRVEFEGFEAVDVRLGLGVDTFRVGVGDIFDQLPLNRQDIFEEDGFTLTHTINGMTTISGGGSTDNIAVEATNTLDRDALNAALGVVSADIADTIEGLQGTSNEVQRVSVNADVGTFTLKFRFQETAPIALNATALEVEEALAKLFIIGKNNLGQSNVHVTKDGDDFIIEFVNDLGLTDVAQLEARVTPLAIFGNDGSDVLLVEAVNEDMFFLGGGGDDTVRLNIDVGTLAPLTTNGVNAEVTLDGGNESDTYNIGLIGDATHSLINVFDSGGPGTDVLNVEGTDDPDLFLLRAAAAQSGLAFVALLNTDPNYERVNYNTNLETINILSKLGDDRFYFDDTRAAITVFAGGGNDFFQVGQLYKSQRTTEQAGVAVEDVFATIETTRGWLSNGISVDLTVNAGDGDDEFIVFHNKAVLTANGEAGDDRFLIQAFALVGSQEDLRERTDVSGGADADFIAYAVNAPVAINGGDGFDTVVVVGTEFSDDFVITEDGVFGAGINVSFVNVEKVEVSGTEGDDRFFILGTGASFSTSIVGDLGSDTFFVNGPTPANGVISNDLLGHSGIITHDVSSGDSGYDGLKAVGVSANVADNDEPAIIVTQSDGGSQVVEGGVFDTYTVVLARAPRPGTQVKVSALPPQGLVFVDEDGQEIRKDDGTPDGVELKFNGGNWFTPQTVRFKAINDSLVEGGQSVAIQHKVSTFEVVTQPVFETQQVFETIPVFAFQPIFRTFNFGFLGSVTLLVGIQKIQVGSFQVLVGTQQVQVDTIGTEVTVSDAFTGVINQAVGLKTDVVVDTTVDGETGVNEVQTITVDPDVGVYTLRFGLEDTAPIHFGETAVDLEDKLEAFAGIDDVDVVKSMSGGNEIFTITFLGTLGGKDVEELIARVGASLQDDQATFPTGGPGSTTPQGLRGSFVTIIDDPLNPSSVGQSRQILSNTGTVLTLDQAWDSLPSNQARYEILQFNGLVIPTVEVAIEDSDAASLVVWQNGGETFVAEGSASGSDTIEVSLGMAPAAGQTITVTLNGHDQLEFSDDTLEFTAANYLTPQVITITAVNDTAVEGFHRADFTLTTSNGVTKTFVANVGDDDHEGVLIIESNGSTDVAEGGAQDTYEVVLTQAPGTGETVTVKVTAQPTRTSKTGSIAGHPDSVRSFVEQVEVSLDGIAWSAFVNVLFDEDNWDTKQTIHVRAKDDAIVDGGDTQVFAPILDLANNIQGPLFIIGGIGVDRSGLFEREPIMLPVSANPEFTREVNFKDSIGVVLAATEAAPGVPATITVDPNDPDLLSFLGVASRDEIDLESLNNLALEITRGEGKNKVRFIENAEFDVDGNLLLTLNKAWDNPFNEPGVPNSGSQYTLFDANPNFFVVEADQTDLLYFNDTDNVTSSPTPFAEGSLFTQGDFGRITGLGMGGDRTIGGRLQPGGVSFQELEEVEINLGTGANHFTLDDTHAGATTLNTGMGNDVVDIRKVSGHTFVNTGAGSDTVNVHNQAQSLNDLRGLLTVSGDIPQASVVDLANGSPAIGTLVTAVDAIQRLTVDATGGTFTLAFGDEIAEDLAFDISAAELQAALEELEGIGAGNVEVTKAGSIYRIAFRGALGAQHVDLLAVNDFGLSNGEGSSDILNVDDSGSLLSSVGVLTGTTLTGLGMPQANEIQSIVVDATEGAFRLSFEGAQTGDLAFNASAAQVQAALEALTGIGAGNVAVTKNDDVYVVRFQGDLTNTNAAQILALAQPSLMKTIERAGGELDLVDGSVTTATRVDGNAASPVNDVQTLTVDATEGSYTLTVFGRTTGPIAFDASAEAVRKALQLAVADDKFEEVKTDVTVDKYGSVYVVGFQGKLRELGDAVGVDFMTVANSTNGSVEIATRMDGMNYYGFETLNIELNDQGHIFNVQGTTAGSSGFTGFASTNVSLGDGNEQIFIASNADLDFHSAAGFEFLTGDLDGVLGAINLDTGSGRHRLMISDEAATAGDSNVRISDVQPLTLEGLAAVADIWIQGLADGGISYRTDGNFYDGIIYWTGSGDDTLFINGTHETAGERTTTVLNTGLGNDHVTVDLDSGEDGFFVLHTMGGAASFTPVDPGLEGTASDDDTVRAAASTLPLIVFGGLGDDDIIAGQNEDVVFGDLGRVQYLDGDGNLVAVFGFGGRDDFISSEIIDPTWVISRDLNLGGVDILEGQADDDILIGGAGGNSIGDYIDGDTGDDLIFGDAARLERRDIDVDTLGDIRDPRFQALLGQVIYSRRDLTAAAQGIVTLPEANATGQVLVQDIDRNFRNQDGTTPAAWNEYVIVELYHSQTIADGDVAGLETSFGDDYIAGGTQHDTIFGQLGDDTIQGDGSIASAVGAESVNVNRIAHPQAGLAPVGAARLPDGTLDLAESFETADDGDDYIEGNGGNDVIFGNLGQDDIIGGSSSLFTLDTRAKRPDGSDVIFGGAGTDIARNNMGDEAATGHARDSDVILGDNGNIYRLVGTNGTAGTGFLSFNYDNYTNGLPAVQQLKIIARAAELLDYTAGGVDFNPAGQALDIGAADELHGESGDDFIYGQMGSDVLFGEGQDDDLIGGYGHDWISGGTGQDGVLGDDGRIFTSRNGTAEPLHGIAATTQTFITTPGNVQQATINVTGTLLKSVDLTPFNPDPSGVELFVATLADDIIYGGLGGDFLHGGSGDDAISGAEALPEFYARPVNLGDVLAYNEATGEFAAYDEFEPRTKIAGFLLNFNHTEGPAVTSASGITVHTDGDDKIFGDLGHDWLVGGTGRDNIYGGWGDDLLNADDDLDGQGGLNTAPDTHASYEDRAYGGAGRDRLIANTGGDRLIDWAGEFNSYLVPFSPFGLGTVSRMLAPALAEFLYDLSEADGADFTRAADEGSDPARNGEPFGELGVVRQQDFAWRDQTGGPDDPQAGNFHGPRDVLRSASFTDPVNSMEGFAADSGTWAVENGVLRVTAESTNGDAVAVYHVGEQLPVYFEAQASLQTVKPVAGWKANSYIIFDYNSPNDFKFAGIDASTKKLQIGHRDASGWHIDKSSNVNFKGETFYNAMLSVNGLNATITIDNKDTLTHTFTPRVINGWSYGLNWGYVGVGSEQSRGAYDNVRIQVLQAQVTFDNTENFSDGVADLFTGGSTGTWGVAGGRYTATPVNPASVSLLDLGPDNLSVDSVLDLSAKIKVADNNLRAGFVFDRYSADNFKFVAIDAGTNQVIIGHYTKKTGWVNDAVVSRAIDPLMVDGTPTPRDYLLGMSLKGSTVSVTLDGQAVVGFAFNAVTVDGYFGLMVSAGNASFDDVRVKTSDRAFAAGGGSNMMASEAAVMADSASMLTQSELDTITVSAMSDWIDRLGDGNPMLAGFGDVRLSVADLGGLALGYTEGRHVWIDSNAAGYGWSIGDVDSGRMDLVTVVTHELGNLIGITDNDLRFGVMDEDLEAGVRYSLGAVGFDADPSKPIGNDTLWQLARRLADWEPQRTGTGMPTFELGGQGSASGGEIDWQGNAANAWNGSLSPFTTSKLAKNATANFADYLKKLVSSGSRDAGSAPAAGFDSLGKSLLGTKNAGKGNR